MTFENERVYCHEIKTNHVPALFEPQGACSCHRLMDHHEHVGFF